MTKKKKKLNETSKKKETTKLSFSLFFRKIFFLFKFNDFKPFFTKTSHRECNLCVVTKFIKFIDN